MDKIYLKDNYIVTELGGITAVFPKNYSSYSENTTGFYINSTFPVNNQRTVFIDFTRVTSVYNEAGTVAYSIATLRSFLLLNTGFKSPSGGSGGVWGSITGTLSDQTDLQSALNAKQNTLISGTNIKTINGNTLLGSGDLVISPSSTITVGTTPVTSGTDGRLLMQKTGKVENSIIYENGLGDVIIPTVSSGAIRGLVVGGTTRNPSMALTLYNSLSIKKGGSIWLERSDDTNMQAISYSTTGFNLTIGAPASTTGFIYFNKQNGTNISAFDVNLGHFGIGTTSPQARLDIRAQGALSTDIAFRVRNSGDTLNFAQFNGDGTYFISSAGSTLQDSFSRISDGRMFMAKSGANFIELKPSGSNRLYNPSGWEMTGPFTVNPASGTLFYMFQGTFQIAGSLFSTGGATNSVHIQNGTAPSVNNADRHWYYSADIVAGNAAPHFRTEAGNIIKLYRETAANLGPGAGFVNGTGTVITEDATFGGYTIAQIAKALANFGLLQ